MAREVENFEPTDGAADLFKIERECLNYETNPLPRSQKLVLTSS